MPDAANPRIHNWVPAIAGTLGEVDEQTYLIGHSMGCQAIARYLENLPEGLKVGGAVFVAGFLKRLTGLEDDLAVQETDQHWLGAPIDLNKVKSHLRGSVAIFSDNDPFVPLDNVEAFRDQLGSKIIIEHEKGHFSGPTDKMTQLPSALESVLVLSQ
jgi:predicted alpha/beta hydrolase family esterase